jgi:hypothetical protein
MITKRLHPLHAKAQKSQSSSSDNSESEGEKETVGVVPTTMTTKALYADILKSKSSLLDSSDSDREKDSEEEVQTSSSQIQSSRGRRQKKQRNAPKSPTSSYDSSTTHSYAEDTILIPGNRLFVGGVPLKLREKDLTQIFAEFGEVQHAVVHRERDGTSKVLIEFLASFPSFPCTIRCH